MRGFNVFFLVSLNTLFNNRPSESKQRGIGDQNEFHHLQITQLMELKPLIPLYHQEKALIISQNIPDELFYQKYPAYGKGIKYAMPTANRSYTMKFHIVAYQSDSFLTLIQWARVAQFLSTFLTPDKGCCFIVY